MEGNCMTAPHNPNGSVFDRSRAPSLKFPTPGTTHTIDVTDWPSFKDSKNFETGQIERWDDGSAKKIVLVPGKVNGEDHALWVTPGTALFAAIEKAQQDAKAEVGPGGRLTISYTHDVASSKGDRFHPAKQYTASYTPGSVFSAPAAAPATPAPAAGNGHPAAPTVAADSKPLTAAQYAALAAAGVDMDAFHVAVPA